MFLQAAVFLWTALQKRQSFFTPYSLRAGVADFLLNVCAILFATTLYSTTPLVLGIFLVTPGVLVLLLRDNSTSSSDDTSARSKQPKKLPKATDPPTVASLPDAPILPVRPFLTHYRGSMLVVTCLAILAVDFPIFPRRFAKVETWGTSLMDLGVGSFVFSAGVVSARALVRASPPNKSSKPNNFLTRFLQAVRHSIPLFVLGFIRLYSVKGLDYAEHVTEYGVHWNFFFTLALLPPFVEVSDTITRKVFKRYETFAIVLAILYELVLNNTDLLPYILVSPRGPDLLSKNREGVFSFTGYLAIFLAGRGIGTRLMRFNELAPRTPKPGLPQDVTRRERRLVLRTVFIQSLIYAAFYWLSTSIYAFNLTVSRRLANLPYVLWVAAFNNAQILLFGLVEDCGPSFSYDTEDREKVKRATSQILRVFNGNGLVIFLVANLGTGLVNILMNTLDMSVLNAMAVLIGYALVLTLFALGLDAAGVKIKI